MALKMVHPTISKSSIFLNRTRHTLQHTRRDIERYTISTARFLSNLWRGVPVLCGSVPIFFVRKVKGSVLDVLCFDSSVAVLGV